MIFVKIMLKACGWVVGLFLLGLHEVQTHLSNEEEKLYKTDTKPKSFSSTRHRGHD